MYGFRRVTKGEDHGAFFHPKFVKDKKDLASKITRVTGKQSVASPAYFDYVCVIENGKQGSPVPNLEDISVERPVKMSKLSMNIGFGKVSTAINSGICCKRETGKEDNSAKTSSSLDANASYLGSTDYDIFDDSCALNTFNSSALVDPWSSESKGFSAISSFSRNKSSVPFHNYSDLNAPTDNLAEEVAGNSIDFSQSARIDDKSDVANLSYKAYLKKYMGDYNGNSGATVDYSNSLPLDPLCDYYAQNSFNELDMNASTWNNMQQNDPDGILKVDSFSSVLSLLTKDYRPEEGAPDLPVSAVEHTIPDMVLESYEDEDLMNIFEEEEFTF